MLPALSYYSAAVASHTCATQYTSTFLWHPAASGGTVYSFNQQIKSCLKFFMVAVFILYCQKITAQKVVPVNTSSLTGIALPQGSKQDKRFLMTTAANATIADAAKRNNVTLKSTEVLYLPLSFTADSLTVAAQMAGWKVTAEKLEQNYNWLERDGKYVLAYYYATKKENSIYFAESNQAPAGLSSIPAEATQIQNSSPAGETVITTPVQEPTQEKPALPNNAVTHAISTGFKFNTSNFDDGWTATEQSDWVEVTKGNIKVLLHYPKEGTVFPADPEPLTNTAWNILVAPRYSNLKNYRTAYITTYNRPYLGMGYLTENATGKEVFVLLFRQGGGWLEFITPDKNTFIQQYKFDPETIRWDSETDLLKPLLNMSGYNRFAVAASDFSGKWTSDFTGIQQMYHVYTGNYAGMNMHQSSIVFDFNGNSYYWKLTAVNGMVGNMKYDKVESSGTFSVPNNWQLYCSKIEKGPKLYHAFWSCIKAARILNLLDADYPGSGIYTQYGMAK